MNIYQIDFYHGGPKTGEFSMLGYVYANSDEQVYEYLKSEPEFNDFKIFNCWSEKENEDEDFKEKMLKIGGEIGDDDLE